MAIKKFDLYSSLWASCDELRGGMDASQYKDYVLFMLFIKYISDKYADSNDFASPVVIPQGASFKDMIALKGKPDIGDRINTEIIQPLIDASQGFIKDGPKNRLREQDLHRIVDSFQKFEEVPRYARMVPLSEIASDKNDYNLNLPRYIDSSEQEDIQDLSAHLNGGIPDRDLFGAGSTLAPYWEVMPTLRATLFAPMPNDIDKQLRGQKWFDVRKENGRYRYVPLEKRGGHKSYFDRYFAPIRTQLSDILETFRSWDTERCEIVATLYAAWNDLLREKGSVSDDMIVHEVLNNWHESKQRIPEERWLKALGWMREKGYVPDPVAEPNAR